MFTISKNTLTDNSDTFDVVFTPKDGLATDIYHALNEEDANTVCASLNQGMALGKNTEKRPAQTAAHRVLFRQIMRDWMAEAEGDNTVPPELRQRYTMEIIQSNRPDRESAITVAVTPENGDGRPAFDLFIEINKGLPCVHISDEGFADNLLHVFATKEGVAVVPDNDQVYGEHIETGRFYEGSRSRNTVLYRV